MINQVIIAGRLVEDPRAEGQGCMLRLELARPARGWSGGPEAPAIVRAVALDGRRAAPMQKFLSKGRDVLIHGHLEEDGDGLRVAVDSFEFMNDGLTTRGLWHEPRPALARTAANGPGARPSAPQVVTAATPAASTATVAKPATAAKTTAARTAARTAAAA